MESKRAVEGILESAEKSGFRMPDRTPEDLGNLSTREWENLHSTDKEVTD